MDRATNEYNSRPQVICITPAEKVMVVCTRTDEKRDRRILVDCEKRNLAPSGRSDFLVGELIRPCSPPRAACTDLPDSESGARRSDALDCRGAGLSAATTHDSRPATRGTMAIQWCYECLSLVTYGSFSFLFIQCQ